MKSSRDYLAFIDDQIDEISDKVGNDKAICALSGGVDSSVTAILACRAGINLENYFIDDFFRKKDEYTFVKDIFEKLGIEIRLEIRLYDIRKKMLDCLEGVSDNDKKRSLFKDEFYKAFGKLMQEEGAKYLLQGTNMADKKMYERGQDQHNVGICYQEYGIEEVIEPLSNLYKDDIRKIARLLGLPKEISERQPFPGPGLVLRCLGEITKEKIELIREAQEILEEETNYLKPFQVLAAIPGDLVCSMIDRSIPNKYIFFVRGVKSKDAMTAKAIVPSRKLKKKLEERLMGLSDKIGRVMWDTTDKPPGTIEYI